ncbi:MAG TPA: fatty acyl-CoA synthetase [Spirochaetota bacterium]|nr:fatty acyl-CoA synthetase [Spirochaetota bacterium]HPC42223.1 fatty acyl-CoA synthetase [Spirochaetota bacterium]HPL17082.1 fatty acyl-CoA synthetase [Spirochaetota bacterium]HQF08207.1 fatty acyl-CoA synthetase [Spirochaetota bacterium]HQH97178.1 fatty acyl-CoA synthetase [Spirochaetota bacterium]
MSNKINRDTIGEISRRAAAKYNDKTAIVFRDKTFSFADLERKACSFANLMLRLGVKKGDRVAINSFNSHHYPISLLGLAKIGAVQVPINFMLNAEEVDYVVTHSGARIFLVEDSLLPVIQSKKNLFKNIKTWGLIPISSPETPSGFFDLDYEMSAVPADDPDIDVFPEDIVQIPYTSGTESRPKGAMLSHRSLMTQYFSCMIDGQYETQDVSLHGLPLFHCAQLHCFLMPFIYTGAENIILHKADPLEMLRCIEKYKVTHMFAPPTVWIGLLNHPRLRDFNLSSLKKAAYGASIMPVEIIKRLTDTFPGLRLWNYYGQTEMGPVATILKPEDQLLKPGSAGKAVVNVETRLMDDDGNFVPVGSVGEIVHRSGQVMTGYLNDPEKSAEAFANGWFHSGDLGKFDEDGYLYVVDRKKDMIKTGGENVASREVEEVIYQHPDVAETAVIGLPDPKWIELVAAVVVLKAGSAATEKDIIDYCKKNLAGFKCPKKIILTDKLPKNPSGKILKRELKEMFASVI